MEINREDIELRTSEHGPVLKIGGTEILLRTFLNVEDGDELLGMRDKPHRTELDSDGDNGSWWNLVPESGRYPWLSIQPELLTTEESEDEREDSPEYVLETLEEPETCPVCSDGFERSSVLEEREPPHRPYARDFHHSDGRVCAAPFADRIRRA